MASNLYSPGQKVLSKDGRDNWDAIFGKKPEWTLIGVEYVGEEKVVKKIKADMKDRFWFAQDIKE